MEITTRHNKVIRTTTSRAEQAREQREAARRFVEANPAKAESTRPAAGDDSFMVGLSSEATEIDKDKLSAGMRQQYDLALRSFAGDTAAGSNEPPRDQIEQLSQLASAAQAEPAPRFDQSTSEGFVDSVYDGLLARDADPEGAEAWKANLDSGKMSSADLVSNILKSDEFKSHELDNEETVELLYETVLGREADAEGLAFHTKNAGEKGIDAVINDLFASDEFKSREAAGQAKGRFAPEPVMAEPVAAPPSTSGSSPTGGPGITPELLAALPEEDRLAIEAASMGSGTTSSVQTGPSSGSTGVSPELLAALPEEDRIAATRPIVLRNDLPLDNGPDISAQLGLFSPRRTQSATEPEVPTWPR